VSAGRGQAVGGDFAKQNTTACPCRSGAVHAVPAGSPGTASALSRRGRIGVKGTALVHFRGQSRMGQGNALQLPAGQVSIFFKMV